MDNAEINTAAQLFAMSRGVTLRHGPHRCFYCGGKCDDSIPSSKHVKESFTSRDTVCGSGYVCFGCVASMDERAAIVLPNGEHREGQKTRGYSWAFNQHFCFAATKSYREWLLSKCLLPPTTPFVICISDSGQKHLLYRAVVCHSQDVVTVALEGEPITFTPNGLCDRVSLCKAMAAAIGKPALSEPLSARQQMTVVERYQSDVMLREWLRVSDQPITRLAVWFCPPKKECELERPPITAAPAGHVNN